MPPFNRPFPALTPNQRLHLETYGYVVIENAITPEMTKRLVDKMYAIEDEYRAGKFKIPKNVFFTGDSREFFRIDNIPHVDPVFFEYVTHPYLVALAEEAIGGEARLEQSDAHIRRAPPDKSTQQYGFHRGAGHALSYRSAAGLYQCHFVKTLTNLTDLGPDDGGTTVIAGSHKLNHLDPHEVIQAAGNDPRFIHSVVAPAGSTLLFFEATIHSSGIIKSDKDRLLIIGGYTPPMFQAWQGYDHVPEFVETVDETLRPLLTGNKRYGWGPRPRRLTDPRADSV